MFIIFQKILLKKKVNFIKEKEFNEFKLSDFRMGLGTKIKQK